MWVGQDDRGGGTNSRSTTTGLGGRELDRNICLYICLDVDFLC